MLEAEKWERPGLGDWVTASPKRQVLWSVSSMRWLVPNKIVQESTAEELVKFQG